MQPIEVVTYKARDQQKAAEEFRKDAAKRAAKGYVPVSQSWADGRGGCLRFILLGGIGALVIKPDGTLTVTYRHDPVAAGHAPIE